MKESIAINSVYIVMHETNKLFDGTEHGFVWEVFADKRKADALADEMNQKALKKNGNLKDSWFYVIEKTLW